MTIRPCYIDGTKLSRAISQECQGSDIIGLMNVFTSCIEPTAECEMSVDGLAGEDSCQQTEGSRTYTLTMPVSGNVSRVCGGVFVNVDARRIVGAGIIGEL